LIKLANKKFNTFF